MGCIMKLAINLLLMAVVFMIVVFCTMMWLNKWTLHGQYQTVPDVKGRPYDSAAQLLSLEGFGIELTDSVYDRNSQPGTVVEQNPKVGTKVKPGRTIYLIINAFSPKNVTVPALTDISVRQATSTLQGLGINNIKIVNIPSEFKDLVLSAKLNGVELQPGARISVTSTVVLEVGDGLPEPSDTVTVITEQDLDLI